MRGLYHVRNTALMAACGAVLLTAPVRAAFIVEPDTDGADDGIITYNTHLTFGNGQTAASQSVPGTALGLTGGDSIFGGNSPTVDQYIYSYTPGADADNHAFTAGLALGNGSIASGLTGGGSGLYNVYACWPNTANISDNGATPTSYTATSDGPDVVTGINQDEDTNGAIVGGPWVLIGTVQLTAGQTYQVIQTAPNTLFTSMRSAGVMWEAVPEPSGISMLLLSVTALLRRQRTTAAMD
jgi:hypothetical protein